MRKLSLLTLVIAAVVVGCGGEQSMPPVTVSALPVTATDTVIDTLHGVPIADPFRWLEDQDARVTRIWIDSQNAYTDSYLHALPGREALRARLENLVRYNRTTSFLERNGTFFFQSRTADQELSSIYMRSGLDGEDVLLVDPQTLSDDLSVNTGIRGISPDGKLLAYDYRVGGADEYEVRFMSVDRKVALEQTLENAVYFGVAILPDKSGLYYARRDPDGPRVYLRRFSDWENETLIFGREYGPETGVSVGLSDDDNHLMLVVWHGGDTRRYEIFQKPLKGGGTIEPVVTGIDAEFTGRIADGYAYIQTSWKAGNGQIFKVDLEQPATDNWIEIVPADENVIRRFVLVDGKLAVEYASEMHSLVKLIDTDGNYLRDVTLPAVGSLLEFYGRWETPRLSYTFTSFGIPPTPYIEDVAAESLEVLEQPSVPFDYRTIETRVVWYESRDGSRVPMFLVHRKGLQPTGDSPTLLYGYGGFGVSQSAYYSTSAVILSERDGILALPGIRGGEELGHEWHMAATKENKQNTFDDFIAAAEWLVERGYTNPKKIAISGGSNGGLLVGAVANQRPDLFAAVYCSYPLLDMLRYHKFLMGPYWISEYGSADDSAQFAYLLAYSPYHNVQQGGEYPAFLFETGDNDTRVAPLHARKMTARLQMATASNRPVFLRYHTLAGHVGGEPATARIDRITDQIAFFLWQLGESLTTP